MTDVRFARAAALIDALGRTNLGAAGTLSGALRLGLPMSLWDVVATTLLMYRFPLLFSRSTGAAVPATWRMALRPYRGLLARTQDRVTRPARRSSGITRWPREEPVIVVLGFVETFYRDVLRPVAERLVHDGTRVVTLHERPAPAEAASGPVAHSIWDHWDAEAESLQADLCRRLRGVARAVLARETLAQVRAALRPEFGDVALDHDMRWLFWRELPRLLPRVAVAAGIVAKRAPALILSADDADPRARIYALLARPAGLPTLLVQQGLSRQDVPEFKFLAYEQIAAMGPSSVSDMIAQGVAADRIVVTGQPGFDAMIRAGREAQAVREELGVPLGAKMTLFASQPPVPGGFVDLAARREMIRTLSRLASSREDRVLVVKPHPGERVRDLRALVGSGRRVVVVDPSRNIAPLIQACDAFVTFFSTAALQALYAGKPVINLDFAGDEGVRMYAESSATWVARNAGELASQLDRILDTGSAAAVAEMAPARRRFLVARVHHTDGLAAARVCDVAHALTEGR